MFSDVQMAVERLRELVTYDPETGLVFWRPRPGKESWNRRFASGKPAGGVNNRYLIINLLGRNTRVHRVAWALFYGAWPTQEIDHINGVKVDNRIRNLREVTRSQNQANRGPIRASTTGFRGVFLRRNGRYQAGIKGLGGRIHLGTFDTAEAACAAYASAAQGLFGEYVHQSVIAPRGTHGAPAAIDEGTQR